VVFKRALRAIILLEQHVDRDGWCFGVARSGSIVSVWAQPVGEKEVYFRAEGKTVEEAGRKVLEMVSSSQHIEGEASINGD